MATDKPPFKLTIKLEGTRPDAIQATLNRLQTLCGEHDQVGELKASATIESWDEEALLAIRNQIESHIRANRWVIDGKTTFDSPLVRPKKAEDAPPMIEFFRAGGIRAGNVGDDGDVEVDEDEDDA